MASYGAINECAEGVPRGSAQAGQVRRIFFGVAVLAVVAIGAVLNLNHISSQVPNSPNQRVRINEHMVEVSWL
jgi:hypothetical protein